MRLSSLRDASAQATVFDRADANLTSTTSGPLSLVIPGLGITGSGLIAAAYLFAGVPSSTTASAQLVGQRPQYSTYVWDTRRERLSRRQLLSRAVAILERAERRRIQSAEAEAALQMRLNELTLA